MSNELLIKQEKGHSFNEFVSDLLALIRCDQWEQGNGTSAEGPSFRSAMLGVRITLTVVSDSRFRDYAFSLRFESEIPYRGENLPFTGLSDALARKLALEGYDVLRPHERETGPGAVRYFKTKEKESRAWKQVVTEDVWGMPSVAAGLSKVS